MDETFEEIILAKGLVMSKGVRKNLGGRILFLNEQGILKDAPKLHELREKRNDLAHEDGHFCTWKELDDAMAIAEIELQHLSLIGSRPKYEFYAEQKPREPPESGYAMTFDNWYGLKLDGKTVAKVSYTYNVSRE